MSLQFAINKGLSALGDPIMNTINWHLHSRGFFIESGNIDIALFYDHLSEIIGNVADSVLEEVYMELRHQHSYSANEGMASDAGYHLIGHDDTTSEHDSIIYKIQQLANHDASEK